ncbi:hypothetical protein KBY66_11680 [Synechococcus sp. Tobar12-5m-g]|uniref:hypothetical protein n=1 Tax=unclassified Synechococcus TaxID=2626047 RepID=UPI0020CECD74|nr:MULTISPECIES: hypothetical protein [unclassified Synechococcus]MCP9773279.1 hypothetical protein [Synechococcus sp. Tobar12-5m-g]MCP9874320.1 hypothetical protein [Synechococcus sp. Cruz CV-v-12]
MDLPGIDLDDVLAQQPQATQNGDDAFLRIAMVAATPLFVAGIIQQKVAEVSVAMAGAFQLSRPTAIS